MNGSIMGIGLPRALQASLAEHREERRAWLSDPEFQRFMSKWTEREEKRVELRKCAQRMQKLNDELAELALDLEHQRKKVKPENQRHLP